MLNKDDVTSPLPGNFPASCFKNSHDFTTTLSVGESPFKS